MVTNGHKKYIFHFFGDNTTCTQVTKNNIHESFGLGFVKYEKIYKANHKLNIAVKEASLCALEQQSMKKNKKVTACFICNLAKNRPHMPLL